MTDIRPFRGVRYANPDLTGVLAPPYDVVGPARQAELTASNEHNILTVDNPGPGGATDEAYATAGKILDTWIRDGVLVRDREASLYVVEHRFPAVGTDMSQTRIGVLALVPALPWEESDIRPHELTFRGPKEDRLRLMRATDTQTSPILIMWQTSENLRSLLREVMSGPAIGEGRFDGEFGEECLRVWRVGDGPLAEQLRAGLSASQLYIADGHHRFETAVAFAAESPGTQRTPSVLAFLADAHDAGMTLLATHRLVTFAPSDAGDLPRRISALHDPWTVSAAASATVPEAGATNHTFALALPDGSAYTVSRPKRSDASPRAGLDVHVLHEELLPALAGDGEPTVTFERDARRAVESVVSGEADIAVLMSAPTVDDVIRVADAGETMPQKSTYFYPKVPTGLVLYQMSEDD